MSSVVDTRKTSPPEVVPIKSHDEIKKPKLALAKDKEIVPEDANIPDNYVAWTLKNQKELPPITWGNMLQNINWISTAVLTITPTLALYGALHTKLRWETAVWSVLYYFITGLGTFFIQAYAINARLISVITQVSLPATTVSGLTALTTPPSPSNTSSPSLVQELLRVPLNGGLVVTVPTIVTLIPNSTLTTRTGVSGGHTLVG